MPSGFHPEADSRSWISCCSSGVTLSAMWRNGDGVSSGSNDLWSAVVRELEERQRAPVAEAEERVAVHPLGAEELVSLGPRGHQRKADEILVERPRRLLVLRDVRVVVQPARQLLRGRHAPSSTPSDQHARLPTARTVYRRPGTGGVAARPEEGSRMSDGCRANPDHAHGQPAPPRRPHPDHVGQGRRHPRRRSSAGPPGRQRRPGGGRAAAKGRDHDRQRRRDVEAELRDRT